MIRWEKNQDTGPLEGLYLVPPPGVEGLSGRTPLSPSVPHGHGWDMAPTATTPPGPGGGREGRGTASPLPLSYRSVTQEVMIGLLRRLVWGRFTVRYRSESRRLSERKKGRGSYGHGGWGGEAGRIGERQLRGELGEAARWTPADEEQA